VRELILEQLRERACVRGKQRTWISALNDEQLYEVFLRLRSGESAKSIAGYAQQAWKVKRNSSVHSLSQGILKFRRRISHLLVNQSTASGAATGDPTVGNEIELDDLESMERIARLQLERIQRIMEEEQETGIKHAALSRDIHALTALIKAVTKAKEWTFVNEGIDPVKRRRFERMQQRFAERWTQAMDELGDAGRNRIVKAIDSFLEEAEKHAVTVEVGEDGEYHLVEPDKSLNRK